MAKKKPRKPADAATWPEFGRIFGDALEADPRTQQEIASQLGVSQQLISRAKTGKEISRINAMRIGEHFDINVEKLVAKAGRDQSESRFRICRNPRCPSLTFAANEGELYVVPRFCRVGAAEPTTCIYCDSQLFDRCQRCSSPFNELRLTCTGCGFPVVEPAESLQGLAPAELEEKSEQWNRRNRRVRESLRDA